MKISFKEVDKSDIKAFEYIAKWANSEDTKQFINVNLEEKELEEVTAKKLLEGANRPASKGKRIYLILVDDNPVGDLSLMIDPPYLHKKTKNSGWISICIGERNYRGIGLGKKAMAFLEEVCRSLHLSRIELGVFEYNKKAIAFYKSLGYKQIGVIKNFTYWNGKWHDDYRMEKVL